MTTPTDTFIIQRMGAEEGPLTFADLQLQLRNGSVKPETLVKKADGGQWFPLQDIPGLVSEKQWLVALLLSVLAGTLAVDRFYLGQIGLGILKLLTCGGMGIWALIDIILIATGKMTDSKGLPLRK